MKSKQFKYLSSALVLFSFTFLSAAGALAAGGGTSVGGGGDASVEMRIDEIRVDLLKWISMGASSALVLPAGLSHEEYSARMSQILNGRSVIIGAVTTFQEAQARDPELKVSVNGQPKTCRGFLSERDGLLHILCNTERFTASSEDQKYRLIHHEFAGLAGIEKNEGARSDYAISNQLTAFLALENVVRLGVVRRDCQVGSCFGGDVFQSSNYKACYETYHRTLTSNLASDACLQPDHLSFNFLSPAFQSCHRIYNRSLTSSLAAHRCIELLK